MGAKRSRTRDAVTRARQQQVRNRRILTKERHSEGGARSLGEIGGLGTIEGVLGQMEKGVVECGWHDDGLERRGTGDTGPAEANDKVPRSPTADYGEDSPSESGPIPRTIVTSTARHAT